MYASYHGNAAMSHSCSVCWKWLRAVHTAIFSPHLLYAFSKILSRTMKNLTSYLALYHLTYWSIRSIWHLQPHSPPQHTRLNKLTSGNAEKLQCLKEKTRTRKVHLHLDKEVWEVAEGKMPKHYLLCESRGTLWTRYSHSELQRWIEETQWDYLWTWIPKNDAGSSRSKLP